MRNFRFKLSHMMPNTWFYKLKDMSKTKNHPTNKHFSKLNEQNQQYFYYTMETNNKISDTHIPEPSRKSCKKARRKAIYRPSPGHISTTSYSAFSESEQIHARNHSDFVKSSSFEFESDTLDEFNGLASWSSSCNCSAEIVIDVNQNPFEGKLETFDNLCEFTELNLPRIQTRLPNSYNSSSEMDIMKIINLQSVKIKKEKSATPILPRKSTGVKVGIKSPKLLNKKLRNKSRKSSVPLEKRSRTRKNTFSESFAVVKASVNPKKDFRDSMVEMIVENHIVTSKELEDLLTCFLSLNSDEYHDVIIKAFEQIWFGMS